VTNDDVTLRGAGDDFTTIEDDLTVTGTDVRLRGIEVVGTTTVNGDGSTINQLTVTANSPGDLVISANNVGVSNADIDGALDTGGSDGTVRVSDSSFTSTSGTDGTVEFTYDGEAATVLTDSVDLTGLDGSSDDVNWEDDDRFVLMPGTYDNGGTITIDDADTTVTTPSNVAAGEVTISADDGQTVIKVNANGVTIDGVTTKASLGSGDSTNPRALDVDSDDVSITNAVIVGDDAEYTPNTGKYIQGITLDGASGTVVENVAFEGETSDGIQVRQGANNVEIRDNTFDGSDTATDEQIAINLGGSDSTAAAGNNIQVVGNEMNDYGTALYVNDDSLDGLEFESNTVVDAAGYDVNGAGLAVVEVNAIDMAPTTFAENTFEADGDIYVNDDSDTLDLADIQANNAFDPSAAVFEDASQIRVVEEGSFALATAVETGTDRPGDVVSEFEAAVDNPDAVSKVNLSGLETFEYQEDGNRALLLVPQDGANSTLGDHADFRFVDAPDESDVEGETFTISEFSEESTGYFVINENAGWADGGDNGFTEDDVGEYTIEITDGNDVGYKIQFEITEGFSTEE